MRQGAKINNSQQLLRYHQGLKAKTDNELQQLARQLGAKAQRGAAPAELLLPAYALVKEACIRQLGLEAYDVQLLAAIALHHNKLVEMQTGEGKTLAAVFPAFLNALSGKGVHILTFNDYLARRDAAWMGPVYKFLGLRVGYIQEGMALEEKRLAYHCDITYATAKEVGFDYLRSFIAYDEQELVLRPFHYAIVDEADALLIDEARNPLVLAGDIIQTGLDYQLVARLAEKLEKGQDFDINDYSRNIFLTEKGIEKIEQALQIDNLLADENYTLLSAISLALHARMLLQKDIDYVVRNGQIKLVDEFTGRIVEGRKWRSGLQTAVEAKEGLEIQSEGHILNSISLQHFITRYPKRAGMTATAQPAASEFLNTYGLGVVVIPPNKPCRRVDHPDEVFTTQTAKIQAIIEEVQRAHAIGQPVLIGTRTVRESENLSGAIHKCGISCQVLNAKNDEQEAGIIARAGMPGAVTISTNMAGRGTDIILGGPDGQGREAVIRAGGLYVIGTNRHDSRRVDQQLRGRSGRQGDIGQSRFFISLEDGLMVKYKLNEVLPKRFRNLQAGQKINDRRINTFIRHIQEVIEDQASEMRRTLMLYSGLVEKQRQLIQGERQRLLLEPGFLEEHLKVKAESAIARKLRILSLNQYDRLWAEHLEYLQQVRDSIHLVRFGGQKPLVEFQRLADGQFQSLCDGIDEAVQEKTALLLANPNMELGELGIRRPASTWTYVVNDNPFGNKLATMLLDNANIGFHADPISAMVLFFVGIFRRLFGRQRHGP
ncbi:MAG: accessory Sec system translocase SecA2 [Lewinellaceae bacterium]|nr:accessory Sec system translocase SecA2 [Lewinellaceae bacterium]MCB9291037.1 accessory Sec system translocase SecA2 [Lewinellaceae bacterium]